MFQRIVVLFGALVILLSALPAEAGGWVLVTLDSLPETIRAGEPTSISFMVRQHGQTPIHSVSPVLTATNPKGGRIIRVEAIKAAELGRYTATIRFPSEGLWEWSVDVEPFSQTAIFAPISVEASESATEFVGNDDSPNQIQLWLRLAAVPLTVMSLLLVFVDRRSNPNRKAVAVGD